MIDSELAIRPFSGPVDAVVNLPGSKSLTNRMLICAALADGVSQLDGVLFAEDTQAMLMAIDTIGAGVSIGHDERRVTITGCLADGVERREAELDAGQSGTTSRFLLPVLCNLDGIWTLDGHDQLRQRPFGDQIEALRWLGADIEELGEPGHLPLRITGRALPGGRVVVRGDGSSQFLSGLLISGPLMSDVLTVEVSTELVSRPYVDMTMAVMSEFGVDVDVEGREFTVAGSRYQSRDLDVEPDASAASYFFGAAAVTGGRCRVNGLGASSLQGDLGFVDVLAEMGAKVVQTAEWTEVTGPSSLRAVTADMSQMSDTAQTLAAVAAGADGRTEVTGIGFIQGKEIPRVDAVVSELRRAGVDSSSTGDGFTVDGGPVSPARIETRDDHRMAMSFALLGLTNPGIVIVGPECVNKTFPGFWDALESIRPRSTPLVVALDGPAGSGKSTVATALAKELGVIHFDTGAMYRAVAFAVLEQGVDVDDAQAVAEVARSASIVLGESVTVNGVDATEAIRSPAVTAIVSATSAIPAVRTEMVGLQREWAAEQNGSVLDGRDIGTVVFPDAPVKFYLTARVEVRALRRYSESTGQTIEAITADIERRDLADSSRATSPLKPATDAVLIDTSDRTVQDIVAELAALTRAAWTGVED